MVKFMKIAFLFPGQGSQYVGMAKEFIENFEESRAVFETASSALGYDLAELCMHGPVEKLNLTENTQPAILAASIAILKPIEQRGLFAGATAGHSLGEYTAITAAGGIALKDSIALVQKRGRYMQEAVPAGTGLMAAILGMEREAVEKTCHEAAKNGIVAPANYNSPGQIVIAGEKKAVQKAIELRPSLIQQISSPLYWEDSIRTMTADGFDTFIEIGPGKVLSGLVKRIAREAKVLNVEDMKSMDECLRALEIGK